MLRNFLTEDKAFRNTRCPELREKHKALISEEESLSYKVHHICDEYDVRFCICELKNNDPLGCNAKHANPWNTPLKEEEKDGPGQ